MEPMLHPRSASFSALTSLLCMCIMIVGGVMAFCASWHPCVGRGRSFQVRLLPPLDLFSSPCSITRPASPSLLAARHPSAWQEKEGGAGRPDAQGPQVNATTPSSAGHCWAAQAAGHQGQQGRRGHSRQLLRSLLICTMGIAAAAFSAMGKQEAARCLPSCTHTRLGSHMNGG